MILEKKYKNATETDQMTEDIHKDYTIEMKDETKNEENKQYELSKEEIENFQNVFRFYSLKENNQLEGEKIFVPIIIVPFFKI